MDEVLAYGGDGFLDFDWLPELVRTCRELCHGRVGVAGLAPFDGAVAIDDLVAEVRRVKDEDELAAVTRSVELSLGAQRRVAQLAGEGLSEIELFTAALASAQNTALEPVEFVGDVFCGTRTAAVASPVAVPDAHRPVAGEPVLADIAIRAGGYWGDTTRTTIVGDNPELAEAIDVIASILAESGRALLPGVRACDVFERMRREILRRFPGGVFDHHGGHGIGIGVGEDPQLIPARAHAARSGHGAGARARHLLSGPLRRSRRGRLRGHARRRRARRRMRTVFVTGAAHGMGLAASRAFARDGDRIFL